jgi:hypothetical protein
MTAAAAAAAATARLLTKTPRGFSKTSTGGANLTLGRGLHSFTSQLSLNASYGIGGARRGCVARVKGVLEGV